MAVAWDHAAVRGVTTLMRQQLEAELRAEPRCSKSEQTEGGAGSLVSWNKLMDEARESPQTMGVDDARYSVGCYLNLCGGHKNCAEPSSSIT
jgi:hypothetical protein